MPQLLSVFIVVPCSEKDFASVAQYIGVLHLDNNDLHFSQFLVVKHKKQIIGFGRLRNYSACNELCSLGVIDPFRHKGIGTKIARALIEKASKAVYVVTVIPEFFRQLGFKKTGVFPIEIAEKIKYCTGSLPVLAAYVAMRHK